MHGQKKRPRWSKYTVTSMHVQPRDTISTRTNDHLGPRWVNEPTAPANSPHAPKTPSIARAAKAAAAHPASTIAVVSHGLVGNSTRNPNPALIPPNSRVPSHNLSALDQTSASSMAIWRM